MMPSPLDISSDEPPQPTLQVGLQLTVSGLQCDHPRVVISQIERLVGEHNQKHPADTLPSLAFTPPEAQTPVDYVHVALSPTGTGSADSRRDLLEHVRQILSGFKGLRAYWKVNHGPDGSRRVFFQEKDEADAYSLKTSLDQHLSAHNIETQGAYVDKDLHRVVYDVVARDSVLWLFQNPPIFRNHTVYPEQQRFVEPVHGFEVAITGLKEIHNAADILHAYFTAKYGDVIASERMVLDYDVYCVVFSSWDATRQVLQDPFTAFSSSASAHYFPASNPLLLYVLNTASTPTHFSRPAPNLPRGPPTEFAEVMALRSKIKELEEKMADASSHSAGLDNVVNVLVQLCIRESQTAGALTYICWSNLVSDCCTRVESSIGKLYKEQIVYEHRLSHATDSIERDELRARINDCTRAVDQQKQLLEQVMQDVVRRDMLRGPVMTTFKESSAVFMSLYPKVRSALSTFTGQSETMGTNAEGSDGTES